MKTTKGAKHRQGSLYRRGQVYWIKYMVDGRMLYQSLQTGDLKKAEQKRAEIMRPIMAGSRADALTLLTARLQDAKSEAQSAEEEKNPPLSIAEAWTAYETATNRPDSSERTLYGYQCSWRRFESWIKKRHPGHVLMRDVNSGIVGEYSKHLTSAQVTASTYNQHIGLLRLVWRCLAEPIRGSVNPWSSISKKRLQKLKHRHKTITAEQFENLLKSADSADLHDLLFLLGMTGQRLVDGVMLRWDCIDFKRKVITLHPVKTARTGKAVHIPIMPALFDMLQKRREMVTGALVFPALAEDYERDRSAISKRVQKAFDKAGLSPRENLPGVKRAVAFYGAHSLRHFFATQALSAGIPGEIVKRITGHTSDAMLEGYEHIDAALIGGLAEKLSNGKQLAALPPPADDIRARVRELAERLNGGTWKSCKTALLELCDNQKKC